MTLCLLPAAALAAGRDRIALPETRPLSWECVTDAAQAYSLPLAALVGILATEGGKTGEALGNTNGTWDMGAFQVNTCHVKELLRAGFLPEAVLRDGQPAGELRSGFYGCTLGRAVGLALVHNAAGVDAGFLHTGRWEVDVAGERLAARLHTAAAYDPKSERPRA